MIVKVCGITNVDDAGTAIEAGANALGFNFYPQSPRYLTYQKAAEIARFLPNGCLKVGVFVNAEQAELDEAFETVGLNVVQLHGTMACTALPTWQAVPLSDRFDIDRLPARNVEAYLLDAPASGFGGSGQTIDWHLAAAFPHRKIIAGGLDASNVATAIRTAIPWGVDACSRLESSPGQKDRQRVRDFVAAALAAAEQE